MLPPDSPFFGTRSVRQSFCSVPRRQRTDRESPDFAGELQMEYLIGLILSLAVAAFAAVIGFDRERAFYPTVLIVIASYYALFAVMGASTRTLIIESIVAGVFVLFAVLSFKANYWLVVAALIGHGVFDFVRHFFIDNPGVRPCG